MGCVQSSDFYLAQKRGKAAERQLKNLTKDEARLFKILLLGPGESGKSTILKQVRQNYLGTYNQKERLNYRRIVYTNILQSIVTILRAMKDLQIPLQSENFNIAKNILNQSIDPGSCNFEAISDSIRQLLSDPGVTECISRSSEFQLNDSAQYFFDRLGDICLPNYVPSVDDILRTRVKTTGLTEVKFTFNNITFQVLDVGGQRSERKKWIHCFGDVTAVLFVVSIAEFDQTLAEDPTVNRMVESLQLFGSIVNNSFFTETSMILFLNKYDIFVSKIKKSSIKKTFPSFVGDDKDEIAVRDFISQEFWSLVTNRRDRGTFTHFLCATDTNNITVVLQDVVNIVTQAHLQSAGLL